MNFQPDSGRDDDTGRQAPGGRRIHLAPPRPAAAPVPPPAAENDELDLADILAQLLARKWLILAVLLLGLAGGAFVGQLPPDEFQAQSVVQVEQRTSAVELPSELIGELLTGEETESSLATEFHIIKSRLILDPVVRELNLDFRVIPSRAPVVGHLLQRYDLPMLDDLIPAQYARPGETLTIGAFIVDDARVGTPFKLEIVDADTVRLTDPDGTSVQGGLGETLRLGTDAELRVDAVTAPARREFTLIREPVRVSAERLSRNLTVGDRAKSEIVDFKYTGDDPAQSQVIVNAIVASYRNQNLSRRSAEIDQTIEFIERQLPDVADSLQAAVDALAQYQQGQKAEELSLGTQALLERAVRLESSLRDLEFREQLMAERLANDHPDMVSLRAGRSQLQARLDEVRGALGAVPEAERELAQLTERAERARELQLQLQSRVEQLRILKASTVANIRVLEAAESAELLGPNRTRPILLGGIVALMASMLGVLALNKLARGIEDARAVEELGLSLYATVHKVKQLAGARAGQPIYSLSRSEPQNLAIESLRGLRTGLQFSLAAVQSRSLMVTSCAPHDGKSFISLNLALVSAETGSRVLLIDCDLRRGELGRAFGLTKSAPGISDLLAGSADFADIITKDPDTGLEFIATGSYPPNPSELLSTQRFSMLINDLNSHYDLIVLDAPPALAVTDPGIIGQSAGMSLLVVSHLKTTKAEIQAAQKNLATSGVPLSGVVLNQFNQKKSKYGSYGMKYGYYRGGYSYKYK